MSAYKDTLKFLYALQGRGMKFGLRNTKHLLKFLGNPEQQFPSVHIAGTNGKGSTAAFLASMFTEAGYKTGLYTSPHLVRFTERIKINGKEIQEKELVRYANLLRPMIEQTNATFFEATTCIAFKYFADQGVEIAILETGLGGRLDSTNVVKPMISVITPIAFDHMEYLGNTITTISREKGGIIKPGVPLVTSSYEPKSLEVLMKLCNRRNSRFVQSAERVSAIQQGRYLRFRGKHVRIGRVELGLAGEHQRVNAQGALATIDVLMDDLRFRKRYKRVQNSAIKRGLARVVRNTGLRARFQTLRWNGKRIIFDVAHNPDGIRILANALRQRGIARPLTVFGVMQDKDHNQMCRILSGFSNHVIAVQALTARALPAEVVKRELRPFGINARIGGSVRRGLMLALDSALPRETILVTGSHYVVGEAMTALEREKRR